MSVKSLEPQAETARQPGGAEQEAAAPGEPASSWISHRVVKEWKPAYSPILLVLLTLACLLPFVNKAFHIDDTAFVWIAKQIVKHPLDPYGFNVVWGATDLPMWQINFNPPLTYYYSAAAGALAGWSERALHLAFLIPAIVLVLGTYRLARHFTRYPLLAAAAALLTPGVIVSATSVMCDTMLLALWVLTAVVWIEGLEPERPLFLIIAALLIAASGLTKYFGACLIPLLFADALARKRRLGTWALYLLIPILAWAGYLFWTHALYGHDLLLEATRSALVRGGNEATSPLARGLVGMSFVGGCTLAGLTFAPLVWARKHILIGAAFAALAGLAIGRGWINLGAPAAHGNWTLVSAQLTCYIAGAISIFALAIVDFRERQDADSLFLGLWIFGTFVFAAFLNWTIDARTVLPLIPAAGILLARRWEKVQPAADRYRLAKLVIPLGLSGVVSLWIATADFDLANSARSAAQVIAQETAGEKLPVLFEGHWGFQYYMESFGARPLDFAKPNYQAGQILAIPDNNTFALGTPPGFTGPAQVIEVNISRGVTTMKSQMGAGFYSSMWGPLPFAFGDVPPAHYFVVRLTPVGSPGQPPASGNPAP
jgi:4-amino-4-deoxy-L-arabinose transferase-like glycosyltransferase